MSRLAMPNVGVAAVFVLLVAVPAGAQLGFGPPAALNSNAGSDSGQDYLPAIATNGVGTWVAVWESTGADQDILFSRSTDDGATWTAVAPLNSNAASDSGDDYNAAIATDGAGNWIVIWDSVEDLGGTIGSDYDILFSRSADNGATWTAVAPLNSNAGSDSGDDAYAAIATDGAGSWLAVWSSDDNLGGTTGSDYDILFSRSTDNGATWTAVAPLNPNAVSDSGSDAYPAIAADGVGNWVAVWHSTENLGGTIGTDQDILFSRSSNAGVTWTAAAPLNSNAGSDSGDDHQAAIAADGAGAWVAVWYSYDDLGGTIGTDADILVSHSTDNGATWTAVATVNSNAGSDSGFDGHPAVATDGGGNWVALWESNENLGGTIGTDLDILASRSTDNGATWTLVAPLNGAASDSGADQAAAITTDRAGNWVAVWHSSENLGGTIGSDNDILVSSSSTVPVELMSFNVR